MNQGSPALESNVALSWRASASHAADLERNARVLCFGDSLVKLGVLPRVLERVTGLSAYNLAVLGGQPASSYFLFRRSLDHGGRPRAVVVDFSPPLLEQDPRENADNWCRVTTIGDRLELVSETRDAQIAGSILADTVLGSRDYRATIRTAVGLSRPPAGTPLGVVAESAAFERNWRINLGAQVAPPGFIDTHTDRTDPALVKWRWRPQPTNAHFLLKFLETARSEAIPVFWVFPPATPRWIDEYESRGILPAYREFVSDCVARYPNVTILDGLQPGWDERHFRDPTHLGRRGAILLSMGIADAIRSQIDRRTSRQAFEGVSYQRLEPGDERLAARYDSILEGLIESRLAVSRTESRVAGGLIR